MSQKFIQSAFLVALAALLLGLAAPQSHSDVLESFVVAMQNAPNLDDLSDDVDEGADEIFEDDGLWETVINGTPDTNAPGAHPGFFGLLFLANQMAETGTKQIYDDAFDDYDLHSSNIEGDVEALFSAFEEIVDALQTASNLSLNVNQGSKFEWKGIRTDVRGALVELNYLIGLMEAVAVELEIADDRAWGNGWESAGAFITNLGMQLLGFTFMRAELLELEQQLTGAIQSPQGANAPPPLGP